MALAAVLPVAADEPASLLATHGRIEWDAGGLHAATLPDGTRLRFALAYPEPAGVPLEGKKVMENLHWNPRTYAGQALPFTPDEQLAVDFDGDRVAGKAAWTPPQSGKRLAVTLERLVLYRAVAFTRPAPALRADPQADPQAEGSDRQFVFSALYPVFRDPAVNAWVRDAAGHCSADLSCTNRVTVRWQSAGQLSLEAASWSYSDGAAHENYRSRMRHYATHGDDAVHTRFTAYVTPSDACRTAVSGLLVAKLKDQGASWADEGALDDLREPKFIPLAGGIEFHWDPYEVGSFGQGMPSVFLARAELGDCATGLPQPD